MKPARPEWVACVAHYRADQEPRTWCGRSLLTNIEFAFVGIDHAAGVGEQKGRLQACPECMDAVEAALQEVRYKP